MDDKALIPIPKKKILTKKLFGIPVFSVVETEIIEFDTEAYYKKISERLSKEMAEAIDKKFKG